MIPRPRPPAERQPALPRHLHHPRRGLIRQVRAGAALGAVAGAIAGLAWLTFAHGRALGGPAVLGALAGLGAGGWWLWRAGPVRWPSLEPRARSPGAT